MTTEPRDREPGVLSTRTIVLCAVGLGVLAVAGGWVLLANFGHGDDADRNRLDAIRTVGTIVLGAGGAVALLLAARRQQTAERDLDTKRRDLALRERDFDARERADAASRHDSEQRRVTELYTKAAEMLGHEQAAVRLAGLYALERLAQDYPAQRRPVVSVLCAYLRMPYLDPDEPSPKTGEPAAGAEPITGQQRRERSQEKEVRLTVQRLLRDHVLTVPLDQETGNPDYWGGESADGVADIDLDFTGATLVEFDVRHRTLHPGVRFDNAVFIGDTLFSDATFTGVARFDNACFLGRAAFERVTFTAEGRFFTATFRGQARFDWAKFHGIARFSTAGFSEQAVFSHVTFAGVADFHFTRFTEISWFDRAAFISDGLFMLARFGRDAQFHGTDFVGDVRFDSAVFGATTQFREAVFHGRVIVDKMRARLGFAHEWPFGVVLHPLAAAEAPDGEPGWGTPPGNSPENSAPYPT